MRWNRGNALLAKWLGGRFVFCKLAEVTSVSW
ncbi:hypothetical protein NB22_04530 [Limosilactobacillus fermentum NB-22]|uniref:Uncharacterized protein n=1 Tax=Limosilactobacillus fermentum NB-22 TaxID=1408443 RepID=A0A829LV57_LIMFE|nr:hypothetical protein NB22_04530 [Limosilactobacillus fermentum NB-22]